MTFAASGASNTGIDILLRFLRYRLSLQSRLLLYSELFTFEELRYVDAIELDFFVMMIADIDTGRRYKGGNEWGVTVTRRLSSHGTSVAVGAIGE